MQPRKPPADTAPAAGGGWYRQPVLWLGAAILLASLAGCVWIIVVAARYTDAPVAGVHPHTVLDMPVHGTAQRPPPRRPAAAATAVPRR